MSHRRLLLTLGGAALTVAASLIPATGKTVAVLLPAGARKVTLPAVLLIVKSTAETG